MHTRGDGSDMRRTNSEEPLPTTRTTDENSTELAPGQAERMHRTKPGTDVGKHSKNGWTF